MRIQFSCSVLSNSLWPHGLQHTRPPCPSPTPGAYSNSCQWSRWCRPTISSSVVSFSSRLQSFRVFSKESVLCIKWPKYWCFQLHHQSSKEYSGLTSFRIDWFDLLAVQVTLKSLLQWHSSKASILWHSAFFFFIVQLSHPYMTTGKTIALTWQTLVGKAIALLFNILSRSVIAFLPRSKKSLLISWLQSPSAVILEPRKIKSDTLSTVSPSMSLKWWDWMPWSSFSECWALSQLFHSPLLLSSRGFWAPLHFLP